MKGTNNAVFYHDAIFRTTIKFGGRRFQRTIAVTKHRSGKYSGIVTAKGGHITGEFCWDSRKYVLPVFTNERGEKLSSKQASSKGFLTMLREACLGVSTAKRKGVVELQKIANVGGVQVEYLLSGTLAEKKTAGGEVIQMDNIVYRIAS